MIKKKNLSNKEKMKLVKFKSENFKEFIYVTQPLYSPAWKTKISNSSANTNEVIFNISFYKEMIITPSVVQKGIIQLITSNNCNLKFVEPDLEKF